MAYTAAPKKVLTQLRVNNPIATFEEVARLYKGHPKPERGPGRDYASHYMRLEPADRFYREPATSSEFESLGMEMKARWEAIIARGVVKIIFPFGSIQEVLPVANRVTKTVGASAKTMVECNPYTGRNTKWVEDVTIGGKSCPKVVPGDRPCQAGADGICPLGCTPKGMLKISVPEFWPGGIILFPLGSIIDISNLLGALQPYEGIDLRGVPSWSLFRKEQQISWEDGAKGTQVKANWSLNLTIDPQITAALAAQQQRRFLQSINEDAPSIAPTQQKAIAPARRAPFRNSADHQAMQAAIDAAVRAQDSAAIDLAIEAALDLFDQGFFEEDGKRIVNQAWELAQDRIAQRASIEPKRESNPTAFAGAIAEAELVEESIAKEFWGKLKAGGWTPDDLRKALDGLGYASLKVIPDDQWEAIKTKIEKALEVNDRGI